MKAGHYRGNEKKNRTRRDKSAPRGTTPGSTTTQKTVPAGKKEYDAMSTY
jgi:hypothetical protein